MQGRQRKTVAILDQLSAGVATFSITHVSTSKSNFQHIIQQTTVECIKTRLYYYQDTSPAISSFYERAATNLAWKYLRDMFNNVICSPCAFLFINKPLSPSR